MNVIPSGAPADGAGSNKVGVYYNYCAASAGSYCYDESKGTGNASYDLCPAGWRMPTSGSSGEYKALYTAYSSDQATFKTPCLRLSLATSTVARWAIRARAAASGLLLTTMLTLCTASSSVLAV